jgi:hypothetical protein
MVEISFQYSKEQLQAGTYAELNYFAVFLKQYYFQPHLLQTYSVPKHWALLADQGT